MVYLCLASETSGLHGGQDGLRLRVARFTSIGDLLATEANSLFVFGFWVFFASFFFFGCVGCFGPFVFVCLFVCLFQLVGHRDFTMVIHLSALAESSDSRPDAGDRLPLVHGLSVFFETSRSYS